MTGTGGTSTATAVGSDLGGKLTALTGTGNSAASGIVMTVNFENAYATTPVAVILTPANLAAKNLSGAGDVYVSSVGTSNFVITAGSTRLTAGTTYEWYYFIVQ